MDLLGIGINISLGRSHLFYLVGIAGLIVIDQRVGIDGLIDIVIVCISPDILLLKLAVQTEGAADIVLVGCGIIDIRSIDGSIVAIDVFGDDARTDDDAVLGDVAQVVIVKLLGIGQLILTLVDAIALDIGDLSLGVVLIDVLVGLGKYGRVEEVGVALDSSDMLAKLIISISDDRKRILVVVGPILCLACHPVLCVVGVNDMGTLAELVASKGVVVVAPLYVAILIIAVGTLRHELITLIVVAILESIIHLDLTLVVKDQAVVVDAAVVVVTLHTVETALVVISEEGKFILIVAVDGGKTSRLSRCGRRKKCSCT